MKRLKPGDKARVIGDKFLGSCYHHYPIGTKVIIKEEAGSVYDWLCETDEGYKQLLFEDDLQPIERNDEVIATQGTVLQGTEAGIPEPIEPVQEEESQKFFPLEFRLNNIGLLVGSVDIEYVVKYDQALQLAESTISRLKSEIEELKRKA